MKSGTDAACAWVDVAVGDGSALVQAGESAVAQMSSQARVSPTMAKALLERYPSLAEHACNSGGATTFGRRLAGALLPHAAEHLAIELLVRAYPGEVFSGATKQLDGDGSRMRVRVSLPTASDAEHAAQRVLAQAVAELNVLLNGEDQNTQQ